MTLDVRAVDPAQTRPLRQRVLRPHESLEELASHEPPGVHAVGAFDGDELVAVGFVCPDGDPGDGACAGWPPRPSPAAAAPAARSSPRSSTRPLAGRDARVVQRAHAGAEPLRAAPASSPSPSEFDIPGIGPHFVMARRV